MDVLVTGAGRGLGQAVARALVARGDRVWAAVRDPSTAPPGTEPVLLSLDDPASVDAVAQRLSAGELDLLVDNAATTFEGFDAEVVRRTLAVNYFGTVRLTDALVPVLRDGGRIVLVSSGMGELAGLPPGLRRAFSTTGLDRVQLAELLERFRAAVAAGTEGQEGWPRSAYRVSKVALNAYTRLLAEELRPRRIAVNAVCPGWVRTDMGGPGAPRSVAEGAASILATATTTDPTTGRFFRDGNPLSW